MSASVYRRLKLYFIIAQYEQTGLVDVKAVSIGIWNRNNSYAFASGYELNRLQKITAFDSDGNFQPQAVYD